MKNKIDDLRNHLFATLEALQDKDEPMDLDRARTIADVAQTIINSAKVEVQFMTHVEGVESTFFPVTPTAPKQPELPREQRLFRVALSSPIR